MRRFAVVLAALLASAPVQASERDIVAVFEINVADAPGFVASEASKFTILLDSVVAGAGYRTVPRSEIRAQLAEQQAESYRPCYDDACQIEIGKAVAAQKGLSATWARFDRTCTLTIKLYDLKTALAEFSTKADATCDASGLRSAIEQIGSSLRARRHEGYGAFTLDLDEARTIKNPPTDHRGWLKIKAEAKGKPSEKIEVYVNGELVGSVVNGFFTKELPVGRYIVLLRTAGDLYMHQRFDVEMTAENVEIPAKGLLQLQPMFGTLVLRGAPADATAVIDGEPRAVHGALREQRRVGTYTLVVEAPGYIAASPKQVTIAPGEESLFSYSLVRNAGTLSVRGAPDRAEVLLDGKSVGRLPIEIADIDIGDHAVEVRSPGHHALRKMVPVHRGERADVDIVLSPKRARLKIEAVAKIASGDAPVEADILIDGVRLGVTPWKGDVLAEVPHEVELRLGSRRAPARQIEVPEGEERHEMIDVPSAWGGAVSSLCFESADPALEIRSGPTTLMRDKPNAVRAGRIALEFFVSGIQVGAGSVNVAPDENRVITIADRPRTAQELEARRNVWAWRKWIAVGATALATSLALEQTVVAHRAESDRDAAYAALRVSSVSEDVDAYRAFVVDRESARASSENIAVGFAVSAIVLAAWSAYEWFLGEPTTGNFVVHGLNEVAR